uniref:Putative salivary kunitz domain protein n=1 Tax=Ixodes ricinus TaxID=34613 RepID=A0A0K8R6W8_IXORI
MLISAITKESVKHHMLSHCAVTVLTPQNSYYFNNGTGRCEKLFGCGGPNEFPTEGECRKECPYGTYASKV